jgi:hypothetical protein
MPVHAVNIDSRYCIAAVIGISIFIILLHCGGTHTHTHTHKYIYIYIYVCVCVCVCSYKFSRGQRTNYYFIMKDSCK